MANSREYKGKMFLQGIMEIPTIGVYMCVWYCGLLFGSQNSRWNTK